MPVMPATPEKRTGQFSARSGMAIRHSFPPAILFSHGILAIPSVAKYRFSDSGLPEDISVLTSTGLNAHMTAPPCCSVISISPQTNAPAVQRCKHTQLCTHGCVHFTQLCMFVIEKSDSERE